MASVELKGLSKRYGDAVAVDDVSLRVEHGQLVCLLGPSGCGKTTTLRLIAGFIEPSAGEIVVGGKVLSSPARTVPPEGRNMSMIFQSYALWPHMTVAENVAYGLKIRKLDKADDRRQAAGDPVDGAARGAGRALSRRAVGRPAAARVARPRAGGRARDAAARRAAQQPRRQSARGDALRDPPPARPLPLHHGLCHARPGRGHDHGRPDRRHEPRQGRAARPAGGDLQPSALGVRRPLHRRRQHPARRGARRGAGLGGGRDLAHHGPDAARPASRWRCRCASTRSCIAAEKPQSGPTITFTPS